MSPDVVILNPGDARSPRTGHRPPAAEAGAIPAADFSTRCRSPLRRRSSNAQYHNTAAKIHDSTSGRRAWRAAAASSSSFQATSKTRRQTSLVATDSASRLYVRCADRQRSTMPSPAAVSHVTALDRITCVWRWRRASAGPTRCGSLCPPPAGSPCRSARSRPTRPTTSWR